MSIYSENQLYKNVMNLGQIPGNPVAAAGISIPIMASDFKTIKFTVVAGADDVLPEVVVSDQLTPPDPNQAASATNQWQSAGYTDVNQVYYDSDNPATVAAGDVGIFNVETAGCRWVFILTPDQTNQPVVDVSLFSNHN